MASAGPAVKIGTLGEPVFAQGETVLCYHGEAIYAAKVNYIFPKATDTP